MNFKSSVVPQFEDYFVGLTPANASNAVFDEYWMKKFKCDLAGSTANGRMCTGKDGLGSATPHNERYAWPNLRLTSNTDRFSLVSCTVHSSVLRS